MSPPVSLQHVKPVNKLPQFYLKSLIYYIFIYKWVNN
ncbi:hypothetical protein Xinn_03217 [Xenorhabdus innexi]|uniref:Transposase n=1 Tax=Xenorhabdus innexi TaxID=290109 RepID=A0A2G0N7F7_9GAMM|nr:hypothetical protein Xinn_03217 [Xenorhabdus innexi]